MDKQQDRIGEALLGVIEPGSSWVVRGISNDVLVEPYDVAEQNSNSYSSDLVAQMEAFNERLSNAGSNITIWGMLSVVMLCVAIQLNWFAGLLGDFSQYVQSIWFYLAAVLIAFFGVGQIARFREQFVYARFRGQLFDQLQREGIKISDFYLQIRDDDEMYNLLKMLRQDSVLLDGKAPLV